MNSITTRFKSVVVPVVEGTQGFPDRYLLVKDKVSGDWTFPGGGCRYVKSRARDQDKYKPCAFEEFKEETREAFKGHQGQMKYIGKFPSLERSNNEKIDDSRRGKLGKVRQLYLVYKLPLKLSEEQFKASKEEFKERLKDSRYQEDKYQETINAGLFTMEEIKRGPLDKSGKGLWSRMQKVLKIINQDQDQWKQCKRLSSQLNTSSNCWKQVKKEKNFNRKRNHRK